MSEDLPEETYRVFPAACNFRNTYDSPSSVKKAVAQRFAKPGELDEISYWFPEVGERIKDLEAKVHAAGHREPKCRWGWGNEKKAKPSRSGPMCSSCDFRLAA